MRAEEVFITAAGAVGVTVSTPAGGLGRRPAFVESRFLFFLLDDCVFLIDIHLVIDTASPTVSTTFSSEFGCRVPFGWNARMY